MPATRASRPLLASLPARPPDGSARSNRRDRRPAGGDATTPPATRLTVVARASAPPAGQQSFTRRMFAQLPREGEAVGGAGGGTTYEALRAADEAWHRLRNMKTGTDAGPAPEFVIEDKAPLTDPIMHDVIVCGGTLGIFFACVLQLQGYRVAVIERGPLAGRAQEWNISRVELAELVECGVLTADEVESCIQLEFNPVRVGFHDGVEIWTRDVLNLGVSPKLLIEKVRAKFLLAGGALYERTSLSSVRVHPNGATLEAATAPGPQVTPLTCRLVVDAMGHSSPIVRQARWGQKPDGVCVVVGCLARGFPNNGHSDLIYTHTDATGGPSPVQYFWEAFPAGSGPTDRTTYMFAYLDAAPSRPSLESLFEDYWRLMPDYQGVALADLRVRRALFGFFPNFRDSPLRPRFDRVLHVGDAGGLQSPLSFGGFGSMLRHLGRTTSAVGEALESSALDRQALALVNQYDPGLGSAWMMQRTMSMREGVPPGFINRLLSDNFRAMRALGEDVMRPFLRDVPQFGPLGLTLGFQVLRDPLFLIAIWRCVGADTLVDWLPHFFNLGIYGALNAVSQPLRPLAAYLPSRERYQVRRLLDAWEFGSGGDYRP